MWRYLAAVLGALFLGRVGSTQVINGSFELPALPVNSWDYNFPALGWDVVGNAGVANGSTPWGNSAYAGSQYAYVQSQPYVSTGNGKLGQLISGLIPGQSYRLDYAMAQRPATDANPLDLRVDGILLSSQIYPRFIAWTATSAPVFTATASSHYFEWVAPVNTSNDFTTLIDNVSLVQVPTPDRGQLLQNASFEDLPLGDGKWLYGASGHYVGWTFVPQGPSSYGSGISTGDSTWAQTAHAGRQVAFIQQNAYMTQTIRNLVRGRSYRVVFQMAGRPQFLGNNPVNVSVNGNRVLTGAATNSMVWRKEVTQPFIARSSTALLRLEGTNSSQDATALIDSVQIVPRGFERTP